jgi:hypothetical protein
MKKYVNYATGEVESKDGKARVEKAESKIKRFVKDNKSVILTGVVATATTAFVYHKFGHKRLIDMNGSVTMNLSVRSPEKYDHNSGHMHVYSNVSIPKNQLKIGECGKLKDAIRNNCQLAIGDDSVVDFVSITYDKFGDDYHGVQ